MAESDAAGQPPRRPRRLTIAHVLRDVERTTAPLRALIEKAERETAPMRAAAETHAALIREFVGEEDEGAPPAPPSEPLAPPPPPPKPAAPPQRPPFEVDPPAGLLAALREAFRGFKPTDRWWVHVERELKDAHHRSNPEAHEAFCAAYRNWSAEDLVRHLEAEGLVKPAPASRGETVCERLRKLHKQNPDFAETAPERELAKEIGKKSPGCFSKSHYWNTFLKLRRAEVRARAQLARAGIRSNAAQPSKAKARADNWEQRDAIRNLDSQIDGGH